MLASLVILNFYVWCPRSGDLKVDCATLYSIEIHVSCFVSMPFV